MKAFWMVMSREIAERKMTLLLALGAGFVPLFVPFLPGATAGPAEAYFFAAPLLSATIGLAYAVAFGPTIVVRDLAEHRIAFYFSRPLSAGAIWGGKLAAAWLLAVVAAFLSSLPTLLTGGLAVFSEGRNAGATLGPMSVLATFYGLFWGAMTSLVAILFLHAAASIVRLRSRWLFLDALLFAAIVSATWVSVRALRVSGFLGRSEADWALAAMGLLTAVLLTASYVQIASGRTDVARSHGALSVTLWSLSLLVVGLLGAVALRDG